MYLPPRQALENLSNEEDWKRVAEVEDEDETVQSHQTYDSGPTVSDPAGQRACDEDTNQGA